MCFPFKENWTDFLVKVTENDIFWVNFMRKIFSIKQEKEFPFCNSSLYSFMSTQALLQPYPMGSIELV